MWLEKGNRNGLGAHRRSVATQPKPHDKPLPYHIRGAAITYEYLPRVNDSPRSVDLYNSVPLANDFPFTAGITPAQNRALTKLYEQANQASDLMVAWKERQTSLDMMAGALRRLVRIARAVKRRDPKIVRKVLRRNPKAKDTVKTPAGLWLEYHFGWVPTVMDLHHAAGILGYEFPTCKLVGTSGDKSEVIDRSDRYRAYNAWSNHLGCFYTTRVKIQGEITAINPNIQLATMLGFGQPLSVVWEMIPFSWVVDYFVNVSDLVTNLEPQFPGIVIRNKFYTVKQTCLYARRDSVFYDRSRVRPDHPHYNKWVYSTSSCNAESYSVRRYVGWPGYSLEFSSPLGLKAQQCSYLAAVLVQIFTSFKPK